MKNIFTITALLCSLTCFSATITVSNSITSPAQYSDLQAAINAAQPNDTIQIYGTNITHGFINVNKTLHLIGSGHGRILKSIIGGLYINTQSNGSTFSGLKIGIVSTISGTNLSDYLFEFCEIDEFRLGSSSVMVFNNLLIRNCIINGGIEGLGDDGGVAIYNNIFTGTFWQNKSWISCFPNGSNGPQPSQLPAIVQNNIFLGNLNLKANNLLFYNNIFANTDLTFSGSQQFTAYSSQCWNCVFENNLTYCSTCDLDSIDGSIHINNLENQPIPFVLSVPNWRDSDFNLNPTSAGNNYGLDGLDVGAFGGVFPFLAGSEYGGFLLGLPVVTYFNVLNPIIQQNGQLQIQGNSNIPSN